jgi:hypothetical protein
MTGSRGNSSRRLAARAIVLLAALWLVGCGNEGETLGQFEQRWHEAVNNRNADTLFDLLDSGSQRRVRRELETLRGLDPQAQQAVINQLGGIRVQSLMELKPQDYFALLWRLATEDKRPTMKIEASDQSSAYMLLALEGRGRQRIRLVLQGGRWSWQLPAMAADEAGGWWSNPTASDTGAPSRQSAAVTR